MNAEAANDVDPKYYLNPRSIITVQVHVGEVCVHCVGVCSNICVVAAEWCYEVVGSCEVQQVVRFGLYCTAYMQGSLSDRKGVYPSVHRSHA